VLDRSGTTSKAVVYHFPGQPDGQVLVPRHRDLADYPPESVMWSSPCAVEDRAIWEVIYDISVPLADVLRWQSQHPAQFSRAFP